jgi:MoxR-like ATPase
MQLRNHLDTSSLEATCETVSELRRQIVQSLRQVVVGLDDVADQLLIALFGGGHVLMEGVPGTAKTTLCKSFAQTLGVDFQRIQFTPDLLPSDVTGTYIYDRNRSDFVLRKGPVFTNILLADELNRAPAKTQSSLLEAMQEQQSTIEGTTLALPNPFMVLATQNPIEQEGVYRLPEAQLDRFLLRVAVGYPDRKAEIEMLSVQSKPQSIDQPTASLEQVVEIRSAVAHVYASDEMRAYIIDVARASRSHPDLALGASPRAALCLLQAARASAMLNGNTFITHQDVREIADAVLTHRLILRPEAEIEGRDMRQLIDEVIKKVPINTLKKS